MQAMPASSAPSLVRIYAWEARCEFLRLLRDPAFCVPVMTFPGLFYLLFGVLINRGNPDAAQYLLASYGIFGVMGAALFGFGVTIATDRQLGYLRFKRALPVPPGALVAAKIAMALIFALIVCVVLGLLGAFVAGVRLAPGQWLGLLAVNLASVLPFSAIGLYVGARVGANAAPAVLNLVYLPMAFLSGLWLPLTMLPSLFATLAPAWPAYHAAQLALKVLGRDAGGAAWLHVLVLAATTVVFCLMARNRLAAAEASGQP